jgi:glycosyltransferase involved in cell wall biosynthesis
MTTPLTRAPLTLGIELIDDRDWMGGTLYLRNLALCLASQPKAERPNIRLLGAPATVAALVAEYPGVFSPDTAIARAPWKRWLRKLRLGPVPGGGRIDVLYPGFGSVVPGAITMRWIPDFQHRHLPQLFSSQEIAARDRSIGAIADKPGIVVLSSEVAADDFRRFFPGHVATPRVWHFHSLLNPAGELEEAVLDVRRAYKLPQKYLYLPNQFWVHKNHITVLRALAMLRECHGLEISLVCTGAQSDRRNAAHFESLQVFMRDSGIASQVHLLGLLPRGEQIAVLRGAAAVVQPSLFEGWSTVVEDVRACGRPIFLSDIPVHREQAPRHAIYFAPESAEELAAALAKAWPQLLHGPDRVAEGSARSEVDKLVIESAYKFFRIVEEAVAVGGLGQ